MTVSNLSQAALAKKIVIRGRLELQSPLCIGSGVVPTAAQHNVDAYVLRNKDGCPYIPGTSLAGVLREAMGRDCPGREKIVDRLFGTRADSNEESNQSILDVSDILLTDSTVSIRDGIAVDSYTGTVVEGKKYDYEVVDKGAAGEAEIIVTLRQRDLLPELNDLIGALVNRLAAGFFLGGRTAKGLGRVACRDVVAATYDFRQKSAAKAWLEYTEQDFDAWQKAIQKAKLATCTGKAEAVPNTDGMLIEAWCGLDGSLLVAANKSDNTQAANEISPLEYGGGYIVPGSSVKGVLRQHAERILRSFGCAPEILYELMGYATDGKDDTDGEATQKSRLYTREVYIDKNSVNTFSQGRNRIDRFTGGTVNTALFTAKALWGKAEYPEAVHLVWEILPSRLTGKIEPWEAGLMLILLRDIWQGRVAFGGDKGIGRGTLRGRRAKVTLAGHTYELTDKGGLSAEEQSELNRLAAAFTAKMGEGRLQA